ncbi:MAG: molybdenum cofactor guanylyltransferase [Alcanivorax sp.]|uniref:molybdenum cofactor guanylyltransferase n=1 Tax=Alcanivorax sp. TaxID=1872427 RepID=UPI003DA727CE
MDYTLIILAGGKGKRVGGADKGLLELDGKPLIVHLLDHLAPSPTRIVISANRNQATYQHWADQVVSDERGGFQGPMAGLAAALDASQGLWLFLPCGLVQPPASLPGDLLKKAGPDHICVAQDPIRRQPLCLALHAENWRDALHAYLDSGGRSAYGWLDQVPVHPVAVATPLQNLNHKEV